MTLAFAKGFSETSSYLNDPTGAQFFFDYTGLDDPKVLILTTLAVGFFLNEVFLEPKKRPQNANTEHGTDREYKKNSLTKARSAYLRDKMNDIRRRREQCRRKR